MNSSVVALIAIMFVLLLVVLLIAHKGKPRLNKQYFEKHWAAIEASDEYSRAVIKADALLDEALKGAGVRGGTTGERLNNATGFLRDVNGAWSAHKLRNKLAHEVEANPTAIECQKALRKYKKALRDLGAL
jgi:hypothetical protein